MNAIYNFAIKRPVSIIVVIIALIIMSMIFSTRMNVESFPKIEIPIISVVTVYKGAGPEEVEDQITIPMEEAVGSVGNIKRIESTSMNSISMVLVEFEYGTNMDAAAADVREKIDRIKAQLPDGIDSPVITKANTADTPIVRLALEVDDESSSKSQAMSSLYVLIDQATSPAAQSFSNMRRTRSIAQNDIRKDLEKIAGIASVTVAGGEERAIVVKVDEVRLEALNIPVSMIASAIAKENMDLPSGHISTKNLEFSVRTMGEFDTIQDFENVLISTAGGTAIYLKDVAQIADSGKEVRVLNRNNGKQCVTLEIRKNTDANTVVICEKVKEAVKEINKTLPAGFTLTTAYDGSDYVIEAIENLKEIAIEGAILAILMVFLFLGSVRSTLVIGVSIPISVAVTFLLMYFSGLTINMMTLVGLILVVGNIVDASIVMLENIFRHFEMGKDPVTATLDGAGEVGGAVFGGVMTHIVVFVPIFLISGLAGQIFTPLSKTFIIAMLCSLAAALTIVPMVSPRFLKGEMDSHEKRKGIIGKILDAWEKGFEQVSVVYKKMLVWSLDHRPQVIAIAIGIFFLSLFMAKFIKFELQGKWDRGDFMIQIETPVGSSLSRTREVVDVVEKWSLNNIPEYQNIVTDIGRGPSGSMGHGASGDSTNLGGLTFKLTPAEERKKHHQRSMYDIQDIIMNEFKDYPGAKVQVVDMFSISGKKPIEILVRGDDMDKLVKTSEELKEKLLSVKGLKNIDLNYRPGSPEYRINVDRKKAADLGVGTGEIYRSIRFLMSEDAVSKFRELGNEYDIFIQLPEESRNSIEKIKALKFLTPSGSQVTLADIANVVPSYGPSSITRRDRSRYISVQADLKSGMVASDAFKVINPLLKNFRLPNGISIVVAGEELERQKIFTDMFQALFLSIMICYVFLALQFESFIQPFTIMLAVPLELAGVFGAILITGTTMTMFALLGVIMLIGIVLNSSIVLIDYFIQRREGGMSVRDAVLEAAPLRLRPIFMTAGATMLGMVPLALGLRAGAKMFQSLAIGAIGGLITSTLLTLIVVPVVYSIFEDMAEKKSSKKLEKEKVKGETFVNESYIAGSDDEPTTEPIS